MLLKCINELNKLLWVDCWSWSKDVLIDEWIETIEDGKWDKVNMWGGEERIKRMMDKARGWAGCERLGSSGAHLSLIWNWFSGSCLLSEVPGKSLTKHNHTLATSGWQSSSSGNFQIIQKVSDYRRSSDRAVLSGQRYFFPEPSFLHILCLFSPATRLCHLLNKNAKL